MFHFALDAHVRYTGTRDHQATGWRVIGRTFAEGIDRPTSYRYDLAPWTPGGPWVTDRPLAGIFEYELSLWEPVRSPPEEQT